MKKFFSFLGKVLYFFIHTAIIVFALLLGAIFLLEKGPSPAATNLFVHTVKETSAMKFVAEIFLSDEEVAEIMTPAVETVAQTDTSLINIPASEEIVPVQDNPYDEWAVNDPDGDGIYIKDIRGNGYLGYMMVVRDPSRVVLGYIPGRGCTVEQLCNTFGAVGGLNAGGFVDTNGGGNGSNPTDTVISRGTVYMRTPATATAAFDENNVMHVGYFTDAEFDAMNVRDAAGFGPILVCNGDGAENLNTGINPRAAIGQRADGTVLLLAIEGRQVQSIGASLYDLVDIMLENGAVNALNLDGGSSVQLWYSGAYINNVKTLVGLRTVPNAFIVLPQREEAP